MLYGNTHTFIIALIQKKCYAYGFLTKYVKQMIHPAITTTCKQ